MSCQGSPHMGNSRLSSCKTSTTSLAAPTGSYRKTSTTSLATPTGSYRFSPNTSTDSAVQLWVGVGSVVAMATWSFGIRFTICKNVEYLF